ncbi:hypothetical protein ElyMa_003272300 [Elysia marginata]|uniref:Uncharacterized protein n=1 Tax=Elysia marginata TaxID=1093978 RepID=A0AAV4J7N8_9GAST|nr:hypothetical protein ElyMa_003272300 [Elysia marginata]
MFGRCISYCERLGKAENPSRDLRPCECDTNRHSMCRVCCKDTSDIHGKCQIMDGTLADGSACLLGHCFKGVCGKYGASSDEIIFLKTLSLNDETQMKSNTQASTTTMMAVWALIAFVHGLVLLIFWEIKVT